LPEPLENRVFAVEFFATDFEGQFGSKAFVFRGGLSFLALAAKRLIENVLGRPHKGVDAVDRADIRHLFVFGLA